MSALFAYPKQAEFGRVLPKNKIYEHSGANTRLKELFVEQVEQIVWRYKLAPETINLAAKHSLQSGSNSRARACRSFFTQYARCNGAARQNHIQNRNAGRNSQ